MGGIEKKRKLIERDTKTLATRLTEEEVAQAASELAETCVELERIAERKKDAMASFKADEKKATLKKQDLTDMVRHKVVYRDTEVETYLDFNEVVSVRLDTGEEFGRRRATQDEMQGNLLDEIEAEE